MSQKNNKRFKEQEGTYIIPPKHAVKFDRGGFNSGKPKMIYQPPGSADSVGSARDKKNKKGEWVEVSKREYTAAVKEEKRAS